MKNSKILWQSGAWVIRATDTLAFSRGEAPRLAFPNLSHRGHFYPLAIENEAAMLVDYPLHHEDGAIAYDHPGAIPARVKAALARILNPPGWYGHFHGGSSYGNFCPATDKPEFFDTLADATAAFKGRASGRDRYYPCADASATMHLFREDPRKTGCEYPDKVLSLGARGGVVS